MASCLKPSKLYNRSDEQDLLEQAYEHQTFSLITGRPGSGRTSLAQTLKSRVQSDGGYFLRGKFDQFKCRSPYPAFVAAFSDFAEQVEARGQTDEMRQRIRANVAAEGKILTDMIPALKSMVDTQQHTAIQGEKAVARSMFVFLAFLQAVSSPEQPLVVLFDDLQWADPCSLGLLSTCVSMNKNAGVTFVATCVDNVQPDAILSTTLREMEQNNTLICHIAIKNLPPAAVSALLGDILDLKPQDADSLASYVQARTDGNIYFILELLRYLEQGGFLTQGEEEKWDWTDDNLCTELALKNLLKESVESLSQPVQELLKVAALLGGTLDEKLLSHALSTPVKSYLLEAEKYRLIVLDRGAYRWTHDEVEATVCSLIEPDQVEKTCLAIGRKMWKSMDEEELRDNIFDVLNQLKRGANLITSQKERYAIASLCLWAGEKAAKGSTFRTAVVYLDFGFDLLGPNHWREEYDLSLVLFSLTAEINFCLGKISPGASERSEYLCQQVFDHGRVLRDKVRLHVLRVYMLGAKDQMEDAKRHGLDVLKELDVHFPKKVNNYHVAVEAFKMRRRLSRKSIETLCRLPTMSDPDKIAAVQILNVLFMSAFHTDPLFAPLIGLRMVDLSLNYGLCAVSSVGFAIYGMLVCALHHDVDVGFRLGQLALQILEKFRCGEYIPRVYAAVYGSINRWKHKYEVSLGPLRYCHHVGLETGDTEFALVSAAVWSYTAFNCGKPLSYVDSHISEFLEALESRNHEAQNVLIKPFLQMVRILMGKNTHHTTTLSGDIVEEEEIIQQVVKSNHEHMLLWIHYHKANLNFLFSDFDTSALEITKARKLAQVPFANVEASLIYFMDGMAHLVSARHRSLPTAKWSLRLLKRIAKKAPQNTLAIMYLLQAELFAQSPRRKESAVMNFMSAIAVASDSQVALDIGMAHERFGNFYDRLGEKQLSRNHYRQALEAYSGWGALAKVNHMREVYPDL